MSTVAITCPGCGSASTNEIKPDSYQCESCQGSFNFVRSNDRVVTQDVRTHNCPNCGRAIKAGFGNVCKVCDTGDLCDKCVHDFTKKGLVCDHCLRTEERDCIICSNLAEYACISCVNLKKAGKLKSFPRTCKEHVEDVFWYQYRTNKKKKAITYRTWKCENCNGFICMDCVVKKENFLSTNYNCKNCDNEIKVYEEFLADLR